MGGLPDGTGDHFPPGTAAIPVPFGAGGPGVPGAMADTQRCSPTQQALAELADQGYAADLHPSGEGGRLTCGACQSVSDAADFHVGVERRLEGASDPDDMVLVVGATCPVCGTGGVVVLGYGPDASSADSDVVVALRAPQHPEGWRG